jgi:hypothetical protein
MHRLRQNSLKLCKSNGTFGVRRPESFPGADKPAGPARRSSIALVQQDPVYHLALLAGVHTFICSIFRTLLANSLMAMAGNGLASHRGSLRGSGPKIDSEDLSNPCSTINFFSTPQMMVGCTMQRDRRLMPQTPDLMKRNFGVKLLTTAAHFSCAAVSQLRRTSLKICAYNGTLSRIGHDFFCNIPRR